MIENVLVLKSNYPKSTSFIACIIYDSNYISNHYLFITYMYYSLFIALRKDNILLYKE